MPKTLDTQGFSGLREEVVRSEGRSSRPPVLQALIYNNLLFKPWNLFGSRVFLYKNGEETFSLSCNQYFHAAVSHWTRWRICLIINKES